MTTTRKLLIGIGILALLSPLGLILPEYFGAGNAWGEWGNDELKKLVGYVPEGLANLSSIWKALLPDYSFRGTEGKGLGHQSLGYVFSAIIGVGLCIGLGWVIGKLLRKTR